MFDFVGHPNTEGPSTANGSPTSRDSAITAEDTRSTNGSVQMVVLIIASQEAVLDETSRCLAMRTRGDFEPRVQIVEFQLG